MGWMLKYAVLDYGRVCNELLNLAFVVAVKGEPRKSWVLAEIIEKEYCQAKKVSNNICSICIYLYMYNRDEVWIQNQIVCSA